MVTSMPSDLIRSWFHLLSRSISSRTGPAAALTNVCNGTEDLPSRLHLEWNVVPFRLSSSQAVDDIAHLTLKDGLLTALRLSVGTLSFSDAGSCHHVQEQAACQPPDTSDIPSYRVLYHAILQQDCLSNFLCLYL